MARKEKHNEKEYIKVKSEEFWRIMVSTGALLFIMKSFFHLFFSLSPHFFHIIW